VAAVNSALLLGYNRVDGTVFGGDWPEKARGFEALRAGAAPLNSVYAGDSTVDSGAVMDLIDAGGFNLARSGFDPSRLPSLARLILDGGRKPRYVLLTLTLSHMSEDAWPRPGDVPLGPALVDEARLFYADSNSFKALLCGGCSYLHTLAEKTVGRIESALLPSAPQAAGAQAAAVVPPLLKRDVNFRMVADFKRQLDAAGVKLIWVYLPLRGEYRGSLEAAPQSRAFLQYSQTRLSGIFGSDIVDLRAELSDEDFRDAVHADAKGARRQSLALGRRLAARYPGFRPGAAALE
jgi:hypothetical protein